MRGSITLLQALGVFCASGAVAAELDLVELKSPQFVPPTPTWSVVGSLSPTYTENALFSRDNRRRDVYYEPDVSLRLDGSLSPDLSYRIFARTQYEAFAILTAFPSLAPTIELSYMQRITLRYYPGAADQIKPDVEAINVDFFRQFNSAFLAIGAMKLRDEPARKYFVGHWTEAAQTWLRCRYVFADITTNALIAAALTHGVSYTDGTIDGSFWNSGSICTPAEQLWRVGDVSSQAGRSHRRRQFRATGE